MTNAALPVHKVLVVIAGRLNYKAPTAKDDSFTTTQGTKLDTFAGALPGVLENDVSPEGLPLFVDYFTTAQHGSVFIDAAGKTCLIGLIPISSARIALLTR